MHSIIQNIACFEIPINDGNHKFYFDNFLQDKIVKNIFFLFGNEDIMCKNPLLPYKNGKSISIDTDYSAFDLYITMVNQNNQTIAKNLNYKLISRFTDEILMFQNTKNIDFSINDKLDMNDSFITINYDNSVTTGRILMFVEYYTDKPKLNFSGTISGSVTIEFPRVTSETDVMDFRLSDFVKATLQGKKIKKIEPFYNKGMIDSKFVDYRNGLLSFLDLKCKNSVIDSLPLFILNNFDQTNQVWLDDIEIDFDNSYLKYRGMSTPIQTKLTFFY